MEIGVALSKRFGLKAGVLECFRHCAVCLGVVQYRGFASSMFREDALPTLDEVEKNYYLLKPILKLHPTKKPSTFAIADSLLMLNRMTNGLLMRNVGAGERQEHALQEARWDAVQEGPRPKVPGKARGSQETGWACAGGGGGGLVCESAFGSAGCSCSPAAQGLRKQAAGNWLHARVPHRRTSSRGSSANCAECSGKRKPLLGRSCMS